MRLSQPLTGFAAFQKCIERIYPNGDKAWFKFSHDQFFTAETNPSGRFELWATKGRDTDRKKTELITDTFSYLDKLSRSQQGGCFYVPGKPTDFPLKDYCTASADIGSEMDDGSTQEQWQQIEWLSAVTGLQPGLVISSGGKSLHLHLFLDADIPIAQVTHLKKLLAIALLSDPAVVNPHQPMRIAGFYRQEKGKEQSLEYWSDERYTQEQFLQGLKAAFEAKGYIFPKQLCDERWRRIRKVLTTKGLTPETKTSQIKEILALDEAALYPKPQQYARLQDFAYNGNRIPLEICLTKDDRELIARGVGEGSRSLSAFKLAVNLIATASHLDGKRISYGEDPRLLFDDFCGRCSPPLSSREGEAIWRSASRGSATPSLTDEAIENCISAWQFKQNPHQPKSDHSTIDRDQWQWKFGFPNWFRSQLAKLPQVFKGFGKPPTPKSASSPKPSQPQKIIAYTPGDRLPTLQEYEAMGCPTLRFEREHRLRLYADLVASGWQHILDRSGTGSGKSHDAGLAEPGTFNVDKLLFFAGDHRNPTVGTVEANYTDLPVRHSTYGDGLVEDSKRKTALGNPHIRWTKDNESPNIVGNCLHAGLFHILGNKGYKEAQETASSNPICRFHCSFSGTCGKAEEASPGSNYRALRAEVWKEADRIRLNWQSTPDIKKPAPDSEEKSAVFGSFWEEASRQINPTETVEARLADFDKTFADLESERPEIHDQLTQLRRQLRPLIAGRVKLTSETRYGWGDTVLRQLLGEAPGNIADIIEAVKSLEPDLEEVLKTDAVLLGDNADIAGRTVKKLNKLIRRETAIESKQNLEDLSTNWLLPLLKVWGNLEHGALRVNGGTLTVTTRNTRLSVIAKSLKFNVYLDATADREFLAKFIDIPTSHLIQIEQKPDSFENLKITQIIGMGLAGRDRSESLKKRVSVLKAELRQRHGDIGVIEHKAHAEEGDGWWFVHNRGSNEFQTHNTLVSVGTPYQRIGALQDLYISVTGDRNVERDAPDFARFVQWTTQSELAQTPNRLRANRRQGEQLNYYCVSEIDLEFIKQYYPGCTLETVNAFDLTPAAGSSTLQSYWNITQAIINGARATGKSIYDLTQVDAAKFAQVTQGRISQVASKYGGWKALQKILAVLLMSLNRTANNLPENNQPLDEEQLFLTQTYLPLVVEEDPPDIVEAMLITAKNYGWSVFETIIRATTPEIQQRLLGALISPMLDTMREDFQTIAAAGG